ncbi:3-dehydroquinate synthase [Sphingobacteriaceae bacterium]|nr:3-dehydroquinate synthase [Sphingobacteriaceae bacterium]
MAVIKSNGYSIFTGKDTFKFLNAFLAKNSYSSYFILCDENTLQHCLPLLITSCPKLAPAEIIEIEAGETSKSLEFSANIWQTLIENNADRNSLLINLGGGVVSDLGGFTASVYKRGIDFINVPTSLLAMADASVGGKNGIDFLNLKNVIGTFAQPKAVFVYTDFLDTLSERHFQNGLAEIYKIALISDKKFWQQLKVGLDPQTLCNKSIDLKNKLVLKDPFDRGIRNILNFGHTIGHALEALLLGSKNELLHGEAIIIGMMLESHIAFQKKLLGKTEFTELVSLFREHFTMLPIHDLTLQSILTHIKNDKKSLKNKFRFALIDKIGSCKINVEVTEAQIKKSFEYYIKLSRK